MSIYRKAAKRIAEKENKFSCAAIIHASKKMNKEKYLQVRIFQDYFKPKDVDLNMAWWDVPTKTKNQLARSLALLLMAEIERDLK